MNNPTDKALAVIQQEIGRGGAICKEFNRLKLNDRLDWRVERAYAMEIIANSPSLQRADPQSVGRSLIDLATMGLSLSPARKEAYLIPYNITIRDGNRERKVMMCQASPSYMGLEQIAYATGNVKHIEPGIVHKGDIFRRWADDTGKHLQHEQLVDDGEVTHAYVLVTMADGKVIPESMTAAELMACRDAAARKNNGEIPFVWKGPFKEEMYKKCVIRRAWKHWPKVNTPEMLRIMEAVERTDPMEFSGPSKPVNEIEFFGAQEIEALTNRLREAGVPEGTFDQWFAGLAKHLGVASLRKVPIDSFEEVDDLLKQGLEKWKAAKASRQGDTTPREEAA